MKETPLAPLHRDLGARMVPFAEWTMPVTYADIGSEHRAVRERAGLFDLCHMGRVRFRGPDALALARRVQSNDAAALNVGRTRYALLCGTDGGVIDDVLISREEAGYLLVVNASNAEADLSLFREQAHGLDVEIVDETERIAMIAVQGPYAVSVLEALSLRDALDLGYYRFETYPSEFGEILVSRTGYTGERGYELLVDRERVADLFKAALEVGQEHGLVPCGLGARDTLRLEAGMPLYGHELDRETNPFEAGLAFAVRPHDTCVAHEALTRLAETPPKRRLIGLEVGGRRIPRQGTKVLAADAPVGVVCSGTLSPTLQKNIATAYVACDVDDDAALSVDIRGNVAPARRTTLPFYKNQE